MTRSIFTPSTDNPRRPLRAVLTRIGLVVAAAGVVALTLLCDAGAGSRAILLRHPAGIGLAVSALGYGFFSLSINLMRLILVLRYRPVPAPSDDKLPTLTVVVPAYNEGELVCRTLHSLAASDYPADKIQLIAVDDGSVDDTWQHIERAARELSGRVQTIRCPTNRGKRWALYEGFRLASGEVIVTVDSDSLVRPDTLRNLVAPLACDPNVGAVAGNVRVLNRDQGAIPKLLSVSFVYAFDFVRAAESELGSVLCTPGALSAYRAACVKPVLEKWLNQTYCGRHANIGEDRALTNMILAQGRQVKFQSNAEVLTKVPTGLRGLRRMFTRWARSDVRESIAFARFGFGRFCNWPAWQVALARLNFVAKSLSITFGCLLLVALLALGLAFPTVIGLKLLSGVIVGSMWTLGICWFRGRKADCVFAIAYAVFWIAALWWITPWGLFTSHHGSWLTRSPQAQRPARRRALPNAVLRPWVAMRRSMRRLARTHVLTRINNILW